VAIFFCLAGFFAAGFLLAFLFEAAFWAGFTVTGR